ncbi:MULTISPECIES: hypothetical protein [Helicobacter]|uniref:hypothetical protein n=1 Tax=Helicobacter TaxID=209 RepID=UPI000DF89882|nr:hypothetical protein [Helicobacter fennelliae]STQ84419.1 Uncharacterised protein [Helicobacter fennelliae]
MRLTIFMFFIINVMYADGSVPHFQDMLSNQTSYTSTLHKDKETESKIYYKGTITLSGVLEWQMYPDEVDFYWRLVFFPDMPNVLPRLLGNDNQPMFFAIFLNDTLKKDIGFQKNSFLQIYNVLQDKLSQADEYILGGIAIRATLTLKNYYIEKHLETESDTYYYASIETDSMKISKNLRKWYVSKYALSDEYLLFPISKDPYINLRQSPNGKILKQIQKTDMPKPCECREGKCGEDKGFILNLGKDPTNPKWLKVAYIPPEVKDTSKAIYGVIHESQVSSQCEGF